MRCQLVFRCKLALFYAVIIFFVHNRIQVFSVEKDDLLTALKKTYTCPICLDIVKFPKLTPRGHLFCGVCIESWLEDHSLCPLTKENLHKDQLFKLRLISQTAKYLMHLQSNVEERNEEAEEFQDYIFYKPGMRPYTLDDFMRVCVEGLKYSIKSVFDCAIMTVVYVSAIGAIYLGFIFYLFHSQAFYSSNL